MKKLVRNIFICSLCLMISIITTFAKVQINNKSVNFGFSPYNIGTSNPLGTLVTWNNGNFDSEIHIDNMSHSNPLANRVAETFLFSFGVTGEPRETFTMTFKAILKYHMKSMTRPAPPDSVFNVSNVYKVNFQFYDSTTKNMSDYYRCDYSMNGKNSINIKAWTDKIPFSFDTIFVYVQLDNIIESEHNYGYIGGAYNVIVNDTTSSAHLAELENLKNEVSNIKLTLGQLINHVIQLPNMIASALKGLFDNMIGAIQALGTSILNGLTDLGNFLKSCIETMTNAITGALTILGNTLTSAIETLGNFIMGGLNAIKDAVVALGTFIIDGMKILFIPSNDFYMKYFNELYKFFVEKLGILGFPLTFIVTILKRYVTLEKGDGFIHIPDIYIFNHLLIKKTDFNLKETIKTALGDNYDLYYVAVNAIIAITLINFAKSKYDAVIADKKGG